MADPTKLSGSRSAFPAESVLLVVEVASPSTRTYDKVTKTQVYAEMGIPNYWRVELDPHPYLLAARPGKHGYNKPRTIKGRANMPLTDELSVPVDVPALPDALPW